jgi:hypothetical protein
MNCRLCTVLVGVAALTASFAVAQAPKETKPAPGKTAAQPPAVMPELPPGMSEAEMQACMAAATPGPMHAYLTEAVGEWSGKTKMWMSPESQPTMSECTSTVTSMMDGRFTRVEIAGDMPGMGPFNGFGIYGFDNVAQKFQLTWIDNCGTGMMTGTGDLSSDGKTLTWTCTYNCPIAKKPVVMREVDRRTGKDTTVLEMYMTDLKTGKEFKMMEIAFTRKPGTAAASAAKTSTTAH